MIRRQRLGWKGNFNMKVIETTTAGKEKKIVYQIILGKEEMRLVHDLCVNFYRDKNLKVFACHSARQRAKNIFSNIGKALKDIKID